MKFKLTLIVIFFTIVKGYSCSCTFKPEFKSQNDLNEYNFIAHVKITDIKKLEESNPDFIIHQMSFNILELYKGETRNNIIVTGSHKNYKEWTSCDLGEKIGDEWVVFGYRSKSNKMFTGYCTRSKRVKTADGYQNLNIPNKLTLNKKLKLLFLKEIIEKEYDGNRVEYYENGNKQLEEYYRNKKINGKRSLWYPDGVLQSTQNYKKGAKHGVFKWYSKKGKLIKVEKYKKGKNIDTTTTWGKTAVSPLKINVYSDLNNITKEEALKILTKKRIWKQYIYDKKGYTLYRVEYLHNGNKWKEYSYNKKTKFSIQKYYNMEAQLKTEIISRKHIRISLKEWNDLGKLTRTVLYDKKGKLIKKTEH